MNIRTTTMLIPLIFLPQCSSDKKPFKNVQKETKKRVDVSPTWFTAHNIPQGDYAQQLTKKQAIRLGIERNSEIQARFEEIGISKSDLIQAGFYTNPHLESIFKLPENDEKRTKIEIFATLTLSDLWQVPFRKKVAQNKLQIKTYEIIREILSLRKKIQHHYLTCVYHKEYLALIHEMLDVITTIKEHIEYRYQFGYHTQADKYLIVSKQAEWYAQLIDAQAQLQTAYVHLHNILGIPVSDEHVILVDSLTVPLLKHSSHDIEEIALTSHPYILIEHAKIAKAQATIRYEKSRIFDEVTFGIAYEQDFDKDATGVGPTFGINVPLFNTNYGNIERAKSEHLQAQKTLETQKRMIKRNITNQFYLYKSYITQINKYNTHVLPPIIEALKFNKQFFEKMQLDVLSFLEAQATLYETKLKLLDLMYKAAHQYIELEFSMGQILKKENNNDER